MRVSPSPYALLNFSFGCLQRGHLQSSVGQMVAGGMAAFIIRWTLSSDLTEDQAAALLASILVQAPSRIPDFIAGGAQRPSR